MHTIQQIFLRQAVLSTHSKIGDEGERIDTVNCTDCYQQIHNKNWHYHIRANVHKLNCA